MLRAQENVTPFVNHVMIWPEDQPPNCWEQDVHPSTDYTEEEEEEMKLYSIAKPSTLFLMSLTSQVLTHFKIQRMTHESYAVPFPWPSKKKVLNRPQVYNARV